MALRLTSPMFDHGAPIPRMHTADGADISPRLEWSDVPEGTRSFALVNDDPDAPARTWIHWVMFNIPADARALPEAVPTSRQLEDGTRQGVNDFRKVGYGGPAPPRGPVHRYVFKLYALDAMLALAPGATKKDVLAAMKGHVLGEAELIGTYRR
ncbi:MAG TPA: YbhB/YbcL family Raf kinase inhibitor-like protein [Candidatus Hydrogenedentes bacterium]|nr:YbhB/YbcL family Raf kinase inhibitor-like protein [Candidatus Hydrogenedentota bacterium]HPG65876.1 YbhB/YbcL family Raf kinase inhibitor-like protein [Candidatus Hydrogenedentota bacterium]